MLREIFYVTPGRKVVLLASAGRIKRAAEYSKMHRDPTTNDSVAQNVSGIKAEKPQLENHLQDPL